MTESDSTDEKVSFLFITANVGTLFENLSGLADAWTREVTKTIRNKEPHVIAFHFQEVGGKNAKSSMSHVNSFIEGILSHSVLQDFNIIRGYLDEDFLSVEEYTALGSFYLIHKKISEVQVWDFDKKQFNPVVGKETCWGNLKSRSDICKEKFEQGYFPDCKWSRKGYTRARWKIRNRINSDPPPDNNFYCFGDFNFRLDIKALIEEICANSDPLVTRSDEDNGILSMQYENGVAGYNQPLLKIERKLFQCDHNLLYENGNFEKLRMFNVESDGIELKEFEYQFPPTYPFSENSEEGTEYMKTRCPAWCDRVFLSPLAWEWLNADASDIEYGCIGEKVCMGDHKPIFLSFQTSMDSLLVTDRPVV